MIPPQNQTSKLKAVQVVCPCGESFSTPLKKSRLMFKHCPACQKHLAAKRVQRCRRKKRVSPYEGNVLFGGRGGSPLTIRTTKEVAKILGISEMAVNHAEQSALAKLRAHPLIRRIWTEEYGNN